MDVTRSAGYSGRPYTAHLRVYTLQVSGNSSRYHHDAWGTSNSGYGSYANSASTVNVWVANDYWGHHRPNMPFAPGDYAGKSIAYGSGDGNWKGHDGNGNMSFVMRLQHPAPGPFNTADTGDQWVAADRIGAVPGQVGGLGANTITPTTATVYWSTPSRGNADIDNYDLHVCDNTAFNGSGCVHYNWTGNTATSKALTGFNPGTTYYMRVRAHNGDGDGAWSGTYSFTTLPSTPPTMSVSASPAGSSAVVTLGPPSGVSGVDKYIVTRQYLSPAPIPTPATVSVETTSSSLTISGLTPGARYRWTAKAVIGSYTTPASANLDLTQPQPSTGAGDYFDGASPARTDITFAWTGTANNSTSVANGVSADGWAATAPSGGGSVVLQRVTGGRSGAYCARMLVTADATGAGKVLGGATSAITADKRAVVEEGATYFGSIYVRPSRTQRLNAELLWFDEAGVEIGPRGSGSASVVSDTIGWTRLTCSGTVPPTAVNASVRARDASGEGWSVWLSGEWMDADDAMISLGELFTYFDGNTPDSAEFQYAWTGTTNASESTRTTLDSTFDPLADPDCVAIPAAPRPPVVPSDCIADVGQWRRYWAAIPASNVSDWLTTIPTLELTTSASAERQVRVRVYQNPFNRGSADVDPTDFCSEQIISYIPPNTTMTLDGVTERVWAEVNGGATISADHLLYGSGGTPATWPHLSCGIGYWVSFDVPNEAPAGNLTVRVYLTQRT
jgi:hypothetical protein